MTQATSCSKTALVQNLAQVIAHLSWKVEEVISNGRLGQSPQAATQARLAAAEALRNGDSKEADWYLSLALAAVRSETGFFQSEILRAQYELFLLRWEHGTLDQSLALIQEMIPLLDYLDAENGRPPLGTADLLHLMSYILCVKHKYEEAAIALAGCIPIRRKYLPADSRLVALNEQTLAWLEKKISG